MRAKTYKIGIFRRELDLLGILQTKKAIYNLTIFCLICDSKQVFFVSYITMDLGHGELNLPASHIH
jgi:hypothetical protein